MDAVNSNLILISVIAFIPSAALMIVAGLKRCHDSGVDWWYAIMPVVLLFMVNIITIILGAAAFFFLFFQKGNEGVNPYGTEPLKPYQPQIQWQ